MDAPQAQEASKLTEFPWDKQPWLKRAGCHSAFDISKYSEDERLAFALLEALDFQCWKYKDAPTQPTESEAVRWLKLNKETIGAMEIDPPSYLGLLCGVFHFLTEDQLPGVVQ